MSDQALNVLKLTLLGLMYLFFLRVLWAVWSEVRTPPARQVASARQAASTAAPSAAATTPTPRPAAAPAPAAAPTGRAKRPAKGRRGRAARLVVLEPRHRRGLAVALDGEITLGRDEHCTISIQDDSYVSNRHLRVYDLDGQPMVEDLGSTNGTFHNGNRLHGSKLLHQGDRIQVGTTVIEAQ